MFRKNPQIIQFERYLAMSTSSKHALEMAEIDKCLRYLEFYLKDFGTVKENNNLINFKSTFEEYKLGKILGTVEDAVLDRKRNTITHRLLDFIDILRPSNEFAQKEEETLRVKSEWDIRANLVTFLQFSNESEPIERLFKKLTTDKKWKALIREERRYILVNGEIGSLIPDGIEVNEDEEFSLTDCKTDSEVRFDFYLKNEGGVPLAGLMVEFFPEESQIWIRANGSINEKCTMMNELISWFELQVEMKRSEDFSLCIPSARGFLANNPEKKIQKCPKLQSKWLSQFISPDDPPHQIYPPPHRLPRRTRLRQSRKVFRVTDRKHGRTNGGLFRYNWPKRSPQ